MSFLGSIARGIGGAISGFAKGGPIGAIGGLIGGVTGRGGPAPQVPTISPPIISGGGTMVPAISGFLGGGGKQGPNVPAGFPGAVPEPGFKGGLQRMLPFGQSGYTGAPSGFHVNKAYLRHLRAEAMGRQTQNPFNEQRAKNVIVRNRRMNPLNPRALRAALRRQRAAVGLMKRALAGSGYTVKRSGLGGGKRRRVGGKR